MFKSRFLWNPMRADEDGSGIPNEPAGAAQQENTGAPASSGAGTMSFDDMLKGGYQAEFDRRVNKAIETAKGKFIDPRVAQLQAQVDAFERREAVIGAGVDARFAKFVASEVVASLGDGEKFDEKLSAYVEANPQFLSGGQNNAGSWGRQQHGNGTGQQMSGVEAAFRKLNPNIKYD